MSRFALPSVTLCLLFAPVALAGRPGEPCLRDAPPRDGHPIFGNPHIRCTLVAEPTDDFVATCFTIADLDGDADLDVAITNQDWIGPSGPAHVTVLLNLGDGVFADPVPYECGDMLVSIASGDLDGDADIDLVVTNASSGRVSVLKNNGDGTFGSPTSYAVGTNPRSVAVGDLDGDTDADLVVMNTGSGTISVLVNNGDGTFAPHVTYPAGAVSNPPSPSVWRYGGPFLAIGDLDNDNDLDVVVPATRSISVLMNNGDGTFAPFVGYPVPGSMTAPYRAYCVSIDDWDRDADADLAVAIRSDDPASDDLSVFMNNGDGTFAPAVSYNVHYEPSPTALQWAAVVTSSDVDGDGYADLAVAFHTRNKVVVLRNNRDGTFAPYVYYDVGEGQRFIDLADLSGDGHPDVAVVARTGRYKLAVLFNRQDGTFITHDSYPERFTGSPGNNEWNGVSGIATDDLDLDGDLDLVISVRKSDRATGNVFVMLNDGDGNFTETGPYRLGENITAIAIGDLDGDSRPDIVVGDEGPDLISNIGRIWVMLNVGNGAFGAPISCGVEGSAGTVALADLDRDDDLDVAVSNAGLTGTTLMVLFNSGYGTIEPAVTYEALAIQIFGLCLFDSDLDNMLDAGCLGRRNDVLSVLSNDGNGGMYGPVIYGAAPHPYLAHTVDFDGDEDRDILVTNAWLAFGQANVSWFENLGDGRMAGRRDFRATGEAGLTGVRSAYLNADNRPDFLFAGDLGVSVALGAGGGSLVQTVVYGTGSTPRMAAGGDFDRDGDVDIATANEIDNNFSVLWNSGCQVQLGDFDGDGDVDLSDFVEFQLCFGGSDNPPAATCPAGVDADLDGDGDVDLADFLIFQQNFTGSL